MLFRAYTDPRTPVMTKLVIALLALIYIVSPIDIAPDILPLLGIADDIMIIPVIMWILLPNNILDDARTYVATHTQKKTSHWLRNILIVSASIIIVFGLYMYLRA